MNLIISNIFKVEYDLLSRTQILFFINDVERTNLIAKSCLIYHPDTADETVKEFYIGVKAHYQDGDLTLRYELQGNTDMLSIPPPRPSNAADNLWQHTCFEAFIAVEEEDAYHEFNFSPSGEWAAYGFDKYRVRNSWRANQPHAIHFVRSNEHLVLTTEIPHLNLPDNPLNKSYRLGLNAVLETQEGGLSYWSLCHPAGKPDFHHRSGFTLPFNLP